MGHLWNWHIKRAQTPKCGILKEWRGAGPQFFILNQLKQMLKSALILLIASLPSAILATGAVMLALNGIGIWGWFLAFAILTNPAVIGIKITMPD